MAERKVLHSWKDIATYLGRGVRTIQRYEVQFDLPVRRPAGASRSAVLAFSDELDAWLNRAPKRADVSPRYRCPQIVRSTRPKQKPLSTTSAEAKRSREAASSAHKAVLAQGKLIHEMLQRLEASQAARRRASCPLVMMHPVHWQSGNPNSSK